MFFAARKAFVWRCCEMEALHAARVHLCMQVNVRVRLLSHILNWWLMTSIIKQLSVAWRRPRLKWAAHILHLDWPYFAEAAHLLWRLISVVAEETLGRSEKSCFNYLNENPEARLNRFGRETGFSGVSFCPFCHPAASCWPPSPCPVTQQTRQMDSGELHLDRVSLPVDDGPPEAVIKYLARRTCGVSSLQWSNWTC